MNTNEHGFKHGDITQKVIGVFYGVYNDLGYGFLESVYQKALGLALKSCRPEGLFSVQDRSLVPRDSSRRLRGCDMLVENCVLLELKATRTLDSSHQAQLLNYFRATDTEVGLLLNFGPKPEFKRLLFDNVRKASRGRL